MMLDLKAFGNRLKDARNAAGLSRPQAQKVVGLSESYLYGIEHGRHAPSIQITQALAKLYRVSVDWLCEGADCAEAVAFFYTDEQLQALTGLDHMGLWDAGFNMDDWDWGFVSDKEWTEAWNDEHPEYQYRLLTWMENCCVGYEHVEYNGRHYYIQYHS